MPWQPYYGREGRANQCCSGYRRKVNHQCLEKNNSSDKKTFEKLVGYFLESMVWSFLPRRFQRQFLRCGRPWTFSKTIPKTITSFLS